MLSEATFGATSKSRPSRYSVRQCCWTSASSEPWWNFVGTKRWDSRITAPKIRWSSMVSRSFLEGPRWSIPKPRNCPSQVFTSYSCAVFPEKKTWIQVSSINNPRVQPRACEMSKCCCNWDLLNSAVLGSTRTIFGRAWSAEFEPRSCQWGILECCFASSPCFLDCPGDIAYLVLLMSIPTWRRFYQKR